MPHCSGLAFPENTDSKFTHVFVNVFAESIQSLLDLCFYYSNICSSLQSIMT
jgi:hypothetical protein